MNNKLIITLLIFGFLLSALGLGMHSSGSSDNPSQQEINNLKAELQELRSLLAIDETGKPAMTQWNQAQKQTHKQQQKMQPEQLRQIANPGPRNALSFEDEISENYAPELSEEQIALQEKLALEEEAIEIEATINYLNSSLEQEMIDEKWGPEIEQNLSNNFTKNAPEGSNLLETDCRSTFCRITIANTADADFNPREMLGDLFSSSEGFYNSTVDANGHKITELYVSRNGYNLPANNSSDSIEN